MNTHQPNSKRRRLKLNSNQVYAINVLAVRKRIPLPVSCYFHPATAKFLIKHGIAKMDGKYLILLIILNPKQKKLL